MPSSGNKVTTRINLFNLQFFSFICIILFHIQLIHGHLQYILSASFLGISLITALVLMPILKFNTSKVVGVSLIIFYFVYLSVSLLNAFGILSKL